jgi:hypothetical protein
VHGKMKKKSFYPLKLKKEKKIRHLGCVFRPPHWMHEFIFPKQTDPIFGLG